MKKKFSPVPAECGEKKNFIAKIANLTNIHRANFNAYLIFTENIIDVSDRWRSGLLVGDTQEVEVRTLVRQFHFCKNSGECGEKKIFTAKFKGILTKIHRFQRIQR